MVAAVIIQIFHASIGVKILGIFPFQAKSHTFVATALMLELAKRGHEVTVVSHNLHKEKVANYTEIFVKTTTLDLMKDRGKTSSDIRKEAF
jgi:glucuronosyltransferase